MTKINDEIEARIAWLEEKVLDLHARLSEVERLWRHQQEEARRMLDEWKKE